MVLNNIIYVMVQKIYLYIDSNDRRYTCAKPIKYCIKIPICTYLLGLSQKSHRNVDIYVIFDLQPTGSIHVVAG